MTELPLFPLGSVLVPHGRLPLQIFEQRYIDLVRDTMRNDATFGMVWIRQGSEVAQRGQASPELGDYGTEARIVDWDQLPNGLLGITIEGVQRFDLVSTETRANGLVIGSVTRHEPPAAERLKEAWWPLVDVLRSLENHPHVQRIGMDVDYNDAWQVAYALVQLLPMEEALKYELAGLANVDDVLERLQALFDRVSGEDAN